MFPSTEIWRKKNSKLWCGAQWLQLWLTFLNHLTGSTLQEGAATHLAFLNCQHLLNMSYRYWPIWCKCFANIDTATCLSIHQIPEILAAHTVPRHHETHYVSPYNTSLWMVQSHLCVRACVCAHLATYPTRDIRVVTHWPTVETFFRPSLEHMYIHSTSARAWRF